MSTTRRFSFGIKSLAVLLSVLTVLLSLPLTVFSFDIGDAGTSPEHDASISNSDIIELIENRTAAEKTFRLTDGSFYTAHYDTDIHEEDENGRFNDIDNRLYRNGSVISTSNGRYSFPYKTSDDSSLFTLTGWEGKNADLSLLDFGHAEISAEVKNNQASLGAIASIWSPSFSIKILGITVELGAEVGAIGASIEAGVNGFKANGAYGYGVSLSVSW